MSKIYEIRAAEPGKEPKTLQEATDLAEGQAFLTVPISALCLSIEGGNIEPQGVKNG